MTAREDEKRSLYMIPGTMCDERLWRELLPRLPGVVAHHLVIPRGSTVSELVAGLVAQLPDWPVNLFGFSLGGYLASALATAHPDRVRRLFVCSNSPCALPAEELKQRRQLLNWVSRHGYSGISDRKIAAMLGPANRERADIAQTMRAMDAHLGEEALVSQLGATSEREDLGDSLANVPLPITFCFGEYDTLVTRPWLDALRKHRPDTAVHEVPEAGHMLPLEQPEGLAAILDRWIAA